MMNPSYVKGKIVIDSLPENEDACGELLMELVDYLPKRYPTLFTRNSFDSISNLVMGERHDDLSKKRGTDALYVISRYVSLQHLPLTYHVK